MGTIKNTLILLSVFLLSMTMVNFNSCKKGLSEAVYMEYDQSLNFDTYRFENTIAVPGPDGNPLELNGISAVTGLPSKGVWLIYQICSIKNNSSKSNNFTYDVSKFYVIYNDNKFYCRPLEAYKYVLDNGYPGLPSSTPDIWKHFRADVQTSPDMETIVPNSDNTLSISWRFAIHVITEGKDALSDLKKLHLNLLYDSNEPHMLLSRGQTPLEGSLLPTLKSDLPISCRPQYK